MEHLTRSGDKLIFHFANTELNRLITDSVRKIEEEAYARGFTDGQADTPDLDQPVIPEEPA